MHVHVYFWQKKPTPSCTWNKAMKNTKQHLYNSSLHLCVYITESQKVHICSTSMTWPHFLIILYLRQSWILRIFPDVIKIRCVFRTCSKAGKINWIWVSTTLISKSKKEQMTNREPACLLRLLEFISEITVALQEGTRAIMKPAMEKMQIRFLITRSIQVHSLDSVASQYSFNYSTNVEDIQEERMKIKNKQTNKSYPKTLGTKPHLFLSFLKALLKGSISCNRGVPL